MRRLIGSALSMWLLLSCWPPAVRAEDDYRFVRKWGGRTADGQFYSPEGIAVDGDGNVYVADTGNRRVQKFDPAGGFLSKFSSEHFYAPKGVAVDRAGCIYVLDEGILKFDASGTLINRWTLSLMHPGGIAIDESGNLYVADTGNHQVQKFDSSGGFLSKWGSEGTGDGQFRWPEGIAVDRAGNVYVVDTHNARIQKFDSTGRFLGKWGSAGAGAGEFSLPMGAAVSGSGKLYVADTLNSRIQEFDSNGTFLKQFGAYGFGDGRFNYPRALAAAADGSLYATDYAYNEGHFGAGKLFRVQRFDGAGEFLLAWGESLLDDGQLDGPSGVARDGEGNVYVVDQWNHRIQKFDPTGQFLGKLGGYGAGRGQFSFPSGVAVDGRGDVYVSDTFNNRIQKFDASGTFRTQWACTAPSAVAVDRAGDVYVSSTEVVGADVRGVLLKYDSSGRLVARVPGACGPDAMGIAVDGEGSVYVADTYNRHVKKFDSSGRLVTKFGDLLYPFGIAVDGDAVYVTESVDGGNQRIHKFDSSGRLLATWGAPGLGDGEFRFPIGIAAGAGGTLYVVERDNHRVQEFRIVDPAPSVLANGSEGPLTLRRGEALSVTVSLDPGGRVGEGADWWVLAKRDAPGPTAWWSYQRESGAWEPGSTVSHQGPLAAFANREVLTTSTLGAGDYVFFFGVDLALDGDRDLDQGRYDSVRVTIQ